ncbi:hypothetical protein CCR75_007067 [Bremia lactucae]|uniref:Uncharacterized protein n=1 Tax=Bremia lactucae TaxID=4779 RepID=A0A976NYW2_BRELC|nr:hypothetical protein CCR75_007067 [Bremia lactucae]
MASGSFDFIFKKPHDANDLSRIKNDPTLLGIVIISVKASHQVSHGQVKCDEASYAASGIY